MRQFMQITALVALMLTVATACQKEAVSSVQDEPVTQRNDQVTQRTMELSLETLQNIHDFLLTEVNDLINEGVLKGPKGNGLLSQLKNLQRAINREDAAQGNRILEEVIIPHLYGLFADGILNQAQLDALMEMVEIAAGRMGYITDPDGNSYKWKLMADGKKWMVENLRYSIPQQGYSWYHENVNTPEEQKTYGMLYTWGGALYASTQLGEGWRLPSISDWKALGAAYGTWDEQYPNNPKNYDAYNNLIAGGPSGFNAILGGMDMYIPESGYTDGYPMGTFGAYWSSFFIQDVNSTASYFYFASIPEIDPHMGQYLGYGASGISCRLVHD